MAKKKVRKLTAAQKEGKVPEQAGSAPKAEGETPPVSAVPAAGVGRFIQYLREVKVEFDKVTWSSRKETVGMTVSVLAISFFFAAFLGLSDFILSKLIGSLLY